MKTKELFTLAIAMIMASSIASPGWGKSHKTKMITQQPVMKMTIPIPENITTPAKVESAIGPLEFFDGIPTLKTKDAVYDYVDRARAVQIYISMMPAVSTYSLLQGSKDVGMGDAHQVVLWEQLGDSKSQVLTYNNTSLYNWSFLDLEKDGPTVIELPPDQLGILDDGNMRYWGNVSRGIPLPVSRTTNSTKPRSFPGPKRIMIVPPPSIDWRALISRFRSTR